MSSTHHHHHHHHYHWFDRPGRVIDFLRSLPFIPVSTPSPTSFFTVTKVSDAYITTWQGLCNVYLEVYPTRSKSWALKSDIESRLLTGRQKSGLRTGSGIHPASYPVGTGNFLPGLKRPECGAGRLIYFLRFNKTSRRRPSLVRVLGCSDSALYFTTYSNCVPRSTYSAFYISSPYYLPLCRFQPGKATHTAQVLREVPDKGRYPALQAVGCPDIFSS